jgi:hypothetical protein
MKRYIRTVLVGIAGFALGAAAQRYYDTLRLFPQKTVQSAEDAKSTENSVDLNAIRFDQEPLWAYGFDRPPLPGEKAIPQNPPTRDLRPNEDPVEQTRLRRLTGSNATYSLVDIRDGRNVID